MPLCIIEIYIYIYFKVMMKAKSVLPPCSMNETCLDFYLTNTWQKRSTFVHLLTKGGARPGQTNSSIVGHLWMPQFSWNNQTNEAIKVIALLFHIHSLKVFLGHSNIQQHLLWWRSSGSSWSRPPYMASVTSLHQRWVSGNTLDWCCCDL